VSVVVVNLFSVLAQVQFVGHLGFYLSGAVLTHGQQMDSINQLTSMALTKSTLFIKNTWQVKIGISLRLRFA
jgi:hypothetical protein